MNFEVSNEKDSWIVSSPDLGTLKMALAGVQAMVERLNPSFPEDHSEFSTHEDVCKLRRALGQPLFMSNMLYASSLHLPGPTHLALALGEIIFESGKLPFGWIVATYIPPKSELQPDQVALMAEHPELVCLARFAERQGCEWILFQPDFPVLPSFPTF